jgi:hypothetical protein
MVVGFIPRISNSLPAERQTDCGQRLDSRAYAALLGRVLRGTTILLPRIDAIRRNVHVEFTFAEFGAMGKRQSPHDVRPCRIFHDLIDHVLHRDWDRTFDIGEFGLR